MPEISTAPRERPILFSGPMVRVILDGRKTVTRRPLNARSLKLIDYGAQAGECHYLPDSGPLHPNSVQYYADFCPYGQPGDRLWVRETTMADYDTHDGVVLSRYAADNEPVLYWDEDDGEPIQAVSHWDYPRDSRPSIHMKRSSCRLLLEITDVRVERLQDINDEQAIAEGIDVHPSGFYGNGCITAWCAFLELWESINGAGSWDANPWVWVVEFKRVTT
ncbi:hypothetical protein LF844_09680 [Metapseudomonas lalkuanensis]|uniref:hypothetical protein n=1 Tax=Metapseudomonas lalkuanensis TaxID=2604832 RepID=UPI001CF32EF6|nr:hypothetical protein [Pseudomonas lalkuanensis]UCP00059.1 hypothetical protein LF844_09680 [Pseudomonas lalkuanensis]